MLGAARLLILVLALGLILPANAASFWLEHGYTKVATCPNELEKPLKSANVNSSLLITALLVCSDLGDRYKLDVRFIKVQRNPRIPVGQPDVFHFDWVGLALYRPADAAEASIDWLFDDAQPIDGELPKDSLDIVTFGGLSFSYPKADAERATHMTLYLTFRGRMEQFGLL